MICCWRDIINYPLGAVVAEEAKGVSSSDSKELLLDGGFVMPDSNAFGHTFR